MPTYFMESERIGFSCWSEEDIGLARSLWGDPQVTKLITRVGGFSDDEICARLALELENQARFGVSYWPVFGKATGEFLGCCGLHPFEIEKQAFEIGFHLVPAQWGRGYAVEAARRVIQHGVQSLGVKEIVAGHHPENAASRTVLLRLGFSLMGDRFYPPTGLWHPAYSLVRLTSFKKQSFPEGSKADENSGKKTSRQV